MYTRIKDVIIYCVGKMKTFLEAASTKGFSCQPNRERGWERRDATVRVDWLRVSLEINILSN